jgi:two-component system response regulator
LVEDNPDDEALALRAFAKLNISNKVIVARDGVEALDYLFATGAHADTSPQLPALVLLDLKLPRIDGLEVLQQIRQNEKTQILPVVILTSSREEQDIVQGYNLGANSYVRKPVDYNEFVQAVSQLGVFWLLLNELPHVK